MASRTISFKRVAAPGGGISVTVHNGSDACTLVLVHGTFGQSRLWDPVVSHLPPSIGVIALDLPGHGGSDWREAYTMDAIIEAVVAVVHEVPGPIVLAGHSLGSAASMAAAAQLGSEIAGAAFLDIDPRMPPSQAVHLNAVAERPARVFASFEDVVARESRMAPGAAPEVHRLMAEHGYRQMEDGWVQRFDQRFLRDVRPWDMRPHLGRSGSRHSSFAVRTPR